MGNIAGACGERRQPVSSRPCGERRQPVSSRPLHDVQSLPTHEPCQVARSPFARWRCFADPYRALDVHRSEPFARLNLVIDRAVGLIAADLDGLSDPYLMISVNGVDTNCRTKVIPKTLAPRWKETFDLDVHHPLSVLTLLVYDQDVASHIGLKESMATKLLNWNDDFLGYVDIDLGSLPADQAVSGWWELRHPTSFQESLPLRLAAAEQDEDKDAGKIHIEVHLTMARPLDELCAMCLPIPGQNDKLPALDVDNLVKRALWLSRQLKNVKADYEDFVEGLLPYATSIWVIGVIVLWHPDLIMPILLLAVVAFVAHYHAPEDRWSHKVAQVFRNMALSLRVATKVVCRCSTRRFLKDFDQFGRVEELRQEKALSRRSHSTHSLYNQSCRMDDIEAQSKDKEILGIGGALKGVEVMFDKKARQELRETDSVLADLVDLVLFVHATLGIPQRLGLVCITLLLVCAVLLLEDKWQKFSLQAGMSVILTSTLWRHSLIGRICNGLVAYCCRRRMSVASRQRISSVMVSEEHTEGRNVAALGQFDSRKAGVRASPGESVGQHRFHAQSFSKMTWCNDCGGFLWGVNRQGMKCEDCKRIVCMSCADHNVDGCIAKPLLAARL